MQVKVQALRQGYYNHRRIREGSVFWLKHSDMILRSFVKDEKKLKDLKDKGRIYKSGKDEYVLPSWVKLHGSTKVEEQEEVLESPAESPKLSDEVI
jgi:hypothetical protein